MQWLRDGLGIIKTAHESDLLTEKSDPTQSVYLVPAFVGLGAPWWNPRLRGALFGLVPAGRALISQFSYEAKPDVGFGLAMAAFPTGGDPAPLLAEMVPPWQLPDRPLGVETTKPVGR